MQFEELVRSQAGRFTRGQARAHGFSSYRIRRRVDAGEWRVVRGRVLALAATAADADAREWEALLSCGPGAVLAGPSAARHHGLPPREQRPCVLVPPERHVAAGNAIVLRSDVPPQDLLLRDGLLLTGKPRTVLDCARLLDEREAMALVERALQQRWLSWDELVLRTQLAAGTRNVGQLVTIVRALGSGARSDTERRLVTGLRRGGVTGWLCNVEVSDRTGPIGVLDIGFPDVRLAIELDGRAWHVDRDRFQRDRTRQNRLVAAGWTVLRFTWEDVRHRLDRVVVEIASVLGRLANGR